MVRLDGDNLIFSFPEVHEDAELRIVFHRTLRIPDDGRDYPLPPGLGAFPIAHVDDHADRVPVLWREHGGVMLPMYQAEAMWLAFSGQYPMAVKVAAGKINAVTGDAWSQALSHDPQDYLVTPPQPWLDGYVVQKGVIRQFVAMPLGAGYTAEEQLTGRAEHGGLQILVHPLRAEVWETLSSAMGVACRRAPAAFFSLAPSDLDMGLGAGGRMRQEIFADRRPFSDWDTTVSARCFVHLANSMLWRGITGTEPPRTPVTPKEYARQGLPWFDFYAEGEKAVEGGEKLAGLKTVAEIGAGKGEVSLPENESVDTPHVLKLGWWKSGKRVRDGEY